MLKYRNVSSTTDGSVTQPPSSSMDLLRQELTVLDSKFYTRTLEAGCTLVILGGSLVLFALLSGCSSRNVDLDFGLKAKLDNPRISSSSPLEDKPIQPVAEDTEKQAAKSASK
jgi:hypothetical protein